MNNQPENVKFRKKLKLLEVNYLQVLKIKRKYKLQNENDVTTAKERIKQKIQVKAQRIRRFEERNILTPTHKAITQKQDNKNPKANPRMTRKRHNISNAQNV